MTLARTASALLLLLCFFVCNAAYAASAGGAYYRADKSAIFADLPTRGSAATRLECGSRCLATAECAGFAFSPTDSVCSYGTRLNWTASGGWMGQTLYVNQVVSGATAVSTMSTASVSIVTSASASASTSTSATTSTAAPTTTAPRSPYLAFWGGGGRNFDTGRAQCKSLGYADLISYDNLMGGATLSNEFNITADLFKGYSTFSVYLIGARYNTTESKYNWVSGAGSLNPAMYAWATAVNNSAQCITVDRTEPHYMRSVACDTNVEAIICELT